MTTKVNATALGNAVKQVRGNLTLAQLSNETGISLSYLSDIERGRTVPTIEILKKIAHARGYKLSVTFESEANITISVMQLATIEAQLEALKQSIAKLKETV